MSLFAITREAGPEWTDGTGAFDQPGVADHTAFMQALSEDGFAVFAGPLAGTEHGPDPGAPDRRGCERGRRTPAARR